VQHHPNRLLAGFTGTLKVFDLYSGRVIRECKAESGIVGNFAFSPSSKLLAAGCSDTTISIWPASTADTKPGKPLDEKGLAEVLENGEATDAYAAIGRLIADPEEAIPFLERRLRSAAKANAKGRGHFRGGSSSHTRYSSPGTDWHDTR